MEFNYVAYTPDRKMVKGKLSATSGNAANKLLSYGGYQVVSLRPIRVLFDREKLMSRLYRVKAKEVIMFSRQLALLLESGTDIVTALDLLQSQMTSRALRNIVAEVASDIRSGSSLSTSLSKHPLAFSQMYHRVIAAGEQGGNLELVLRQMADYMERTLNTGKKIKGALAYPIVVSLVAVAVVVLLVIFVLPSFTSLYSSFGAQPPLATRMVLNMAKWLTKNGLYLFGGIAAAGIFGYTYIKTPAGEFQWHQALLKMPIIGRINLLSELSRACRTMSFLFKVGLPLPDILNMAVHASTNKAVIQNMSEVQQDLIRGEGLSRPMARRKLFLPMMVQMIRVGEETGNLDNTLNTVAESFEMEANEKIDAAVGMIQPAMTLAIGVVVAFVAVALISAMYSIYGQI